MKTNSRGRENKKKESLISHDSQYNLKSHIFSFKLHKIRTKLHNFALAVVK